MKQLEMKAFLPLFRHLFVIVKEINEGTKEENTRELHQRHKFSPLA